MVGGVLQLAVQVPALRRHRLLPRIGAGAGGASRAAWRHPGVQRVLRQMAPALLGVSVAQISLLINTQIASHVGVGAVSWLTYADRLMEFPTALLGVALGVVLLPQLSAARARRRRRRPIPACSTGACAWCCCWRCPARWPCWSSRRPWSRCCSTTAPSPRATCAMTVLALQGYGVGLLGLVGVKVLAPGFYAREDVRTPMRVAVVVLVLTQLMNLVLRALAGPCRAGAVDRPGGAVQRRHAAACCCAGAAVPAGAGLGRLRRCAWRWPARRWAALLALGRAAHRLDRPAGALGPARRLDGRWCWAAWPLLYFARAAA